MNKLKYNVDMVFCIDCTGSMGSLLDMVKSRALNFNNDLVKKMNEKGKNINQLRIRVIAFRDYIADHEKAMLVTDFFNLPSENERFEKCVKSLRAEGGGDAPEDGLEALAYAIRSDWNKEPGAKKRSVIVVWTDAPTHKLGFGSSDKNYPANMAKSFDELTMWWGDIQNNGYIDSRAKRLVLFAPDENYWNTIADNWDNVLHYPAKAGNGLDEMDYESILTLISNTI